MSGFDQLSNVMRQQSGLQGNERSSPRIATISSYDKVTHAVKVLIQPEGTESNWMPLGAIGIGNGWGVAVGAQVGDQVLVVFEHGDFESGVIVARLFSVAQVPPPVPSGEIWMVHQQGAFLKLQNDGSGTFSDGHGAQVKLNGDGTIASTGAWMHTGTMHITDNVTADKDITAQGTVTGQTDVVGNGLKMTRHYHASGTNIMGNTDAPLGNE